MVTLDDDPAEGVDVLLEYLYTFEEPDFDKNAGQILTRAEHAFTLGDKYSLPQLRLFGLQQLSICIHAEFSNWAGKSDAIKERMLTQICRIWSWEQQGSGVIRELCLDCISNMAQSELQSMTMDGRFAALVFDHGQFSLDLIQHLFAKLPGRLNYEW